MIDLQIKIADLFIDFGSKLDGDLDKLRLEFLGRKGAVTKLFKEMGFLPLSEKKEAGKQLNKLKQYIEETLEEEKNKRENPEFETFIGTLDGVKVWQKNRKVEPVTVPVGAFVTLDFCGDKRVEWINELLHEAVEVDSVSFMKFENLGGFKSGVAMIFGKKQ